MKPYEATIKTQSAHKIPTRIALSLAGSLSMRDACPRLMRFHREQESWHRQEDWASLRQHM